MLNTQANKEPLAGKYPRVFVVDCSRRYGKDWFGLTLACEVAIRKPGSTITYATALQKDIGDIVNNPELLKKLTASAPQECKPIYRDSYRGQAQGLYFPNSSVVKLVGIDLNPDGLRGRPSDAIIVSEAAFTSDLDKTVETVLLPQFIGREDAFLLMNSTPPESGAHPWDVEFVPDAIERGAYALRTLWDAPQYSESQKFEYLKLDPREVQKICLERGYTDEQRLAWLRDGADDLVPKRQQREYLCKRIREATRVVIPEFVKRTHVVEFDVPEYAHAYVSIDPAVKDLCAINFGVWDFINHRLLICDEFTRRNANTNELVDVIKLKELQLWNKAGQPLRYWDGDKLRTNPFQRVSDVDMRLIQDMHQLHGMKVTAASKDDAEAALHALRNAFHQRQILIHPRCVETIAHLEGAIWNKGRTSYERTDRLGHCDHVDALKYMWRHLSKSINPYPPASWRQYSRSLQVSGNLDNLHVDPEKLRTHRNTKAVFSKIMPKGWFSKK